MTVGRFAPSPTGRMHLGNIYSALLSWLSAKQQGGEWILRIEDLDPQRSRMEYALQAEDDLRWLGLNWDRGGTTPLSRPSGTLSLFASLSQSARKLDCASTGARDKATTDDTNIPCPSWGKDVSHADRKGAASFVQSERSAIYEHYLGILEGMGLTYPCYCTRADIMATQAPHESDGRIVYAGTCRPTKPLARPSGTLSLFASLSQSARKLDCAPTGARDKATTDDTNIPCPSWGKDVSSADRKRAPSTRLIVPDRLIAFTDAHYGPQAVNLASHCGDFIVRRADGAWAYQLAVVVDDALMGVTEVVRGRDLLLSSAQQIYLYELLGFPAPRFCHLPLLINEAGQRLSKRDKSLDMGCLRERYTPEQILGILAHAAGQISRPEPISLTELLPLFSWDRVPTDDVLVRL